MNNLLIAITSLLFILACNDQAQKSVGNNKPEVTITKEEHDVDGAAAAPIAIDKNLLTGKVNYSKNQNFELVPKAYSVKEIYIRKEALKAFMEMAKEAKEHGVNLKIISGARSFEHQKAIWDRKWNMSAEKDLRKRALKVLTFSSMPMASRHHWGTDMDLNSLENSYFEKGEGIKIYKWLRENAYKYGFCQVYSDKKASNRSGYEMEKWHWSYMPLAESFLNEYNKSITYADFKGFQGSGLAKDLEIIKAYVNGINRCKD